MSVGEDCSIVALQNFLGKGVAGLLVDSWLRCFRSENVVEGENFVVVSLRVYVFEGELFLGRIREQTFGAGYLMAMVPF